MDSRSAARKPAPSTADAVQIAREDQLPLFAQALEDGAELPGYRIKRVLGAGGFAITYLAEHLAIGHEIAIKEYLPRGIAVRGPDGAVQPLSASATADLAWGLERFREEARTLGRLKHPNIVPVHNYFEANATAYAVMEFIAGETLEARIERRGALSAEEMARLVPALLAGVEAVHEAGFLHRDIKPSNIMLRAAQAGDDPARADMPVLIDFGAARAALSAHSALTAILSEGYAPYEQYQRDSEQGRYTDIYALGATLYRCVTGEKPAASTSRANARVRGTPDPMPSASKLVGERYPAQLLAAIDAAVSLVETDRPQSIAELRKLMGADATETAAAETPPAAAASAPAAEPPSAVTLLADRAAASASPAEEGAQTLIIGTANRPAPETRADSARAAPRIGKPWLRRAAVALGVLILAGGAVAGYRAYEQEQATRAAAEAERRRVADADAKRRAAEEEQRRAAAEAEQQAQASALRDLEAGLAANRTQAYDEALRRLTAAIATGKLPPPKHSQALLAKAAAWIGKGDFARAFAETSEAIIVDADNAAAYLERGRIRWHRQQWDASLADFNEAIRLAPDRADGYSLRGIVWYHKGDVDRAIADYGEALSRDPLFAEALFNRGLAWHKKGDNAKAAEDFRAAMRSKPSAQVALNARRMLELLGAGQ